MRDAGAWRRADRLPGGRSAALALALLLACAPLAAQTLAPAPIVRFTVTAFEVGGDNPLPDARTRELLSAFVGEHEGLERLQEAARALEQGLRDAGYVFHRVVIPPQRSASGVIELQVMAFTLGEVEVKGNQHFSTKNILASLPGLRPGEVPDADSLDRSMALANRHSFKSIGVTMRESEQPDAIDAVVAVRDRRPWRVVGTLSNHGSDEPARTRASVAFQHGNLFDRDHELVLTYMTSPRLIGDLGAYGVYYRVPFYEFGSALQLSYAKSDVDVGIVSEVFDVDSSGRFAHAAYTQELPRLEEYGHSLTLSVDDKLFESDVAFLGVPIGDSVRTRPLSLAYRGEWRRLRALVSMFVAYARNLPGGAHNDAASYAANRLGASTTWEVLRYGLAVDHQGESGWRLLAKLDAQQAFEPLVAGEQFGVGGANSVRGLGERALSGDSGQALTAEAWTPPLLEQLRLVGFIDAARIEREKPLPGEARDARVASVGVGLRWNWNERLAARLDYGRVLNGGGVASRGDHRAYFLLAVEF